MRGGLGHTELILQAAIVPVHRVSLSLRGHQGVTYPHKKLPTCLSTPLLVIAAFLVMGFGICSAFALAPQLPYGGLTNGLGVIIVW